MRSFASDRCVPKESSLPHRCLAHTAFPSAYLPSKNNCLIWPKYSRADGFTLVVLRDPDQTVLSLSMRSSCSIPPNTIAPRRPFPIGDESSQRSAGWRYQSPHELLCGETVGDIAPIDAATASAGIAPTNSLPVILRFPPGKLCSSLRLLYGRSFLAVHLSVTSTWIGRRPRAICSSHTY